MAITIEAGRIEEVLRVVVAAMHGDYDTRVDLSNATEDLFLEVEVGVNYLLEELIERRAANLQQRDALTAHALKLAEQQETLVAALSTPIIEVWPGVLALPIVGRVDDARAAMITTRLLERVAGNRASHVILDLTGVAAIDVETMPAIVRMIRAITLLGTECMLTGIGPEVARQVVVRGIDATRIRVAGQLSDALAAVLGEKGALRR